MKGKSNKQAEPDLLAKWANVPKFAGRWGPSKRVSNALQPCKKVDPCSPISVKSAKYVVGVGALKSPKQYTGTEMLGVAQMHKSNAVPVFKKEEIVEIGSMRR